MRRQQFNITTHFFVVCFFYWRSLYERGFHATFLRRVTCSIRNEKFDELRKIDFERLLHAAVKSRTPQPLTNKDVAAKKKLILFFFCIHALSITFWRFMCTLFFHNVWTAKCKKKSIIFEEDGTCWNAKPNWHIITFIWTWLLDIIDGGSGGGGSNSVQLLRWFIYTR